MGEAAQSGTVRLAPFDADAHRSLVMEWLQAPHVRRWWGQPAAQLAQILSPAAGCRQVLILVDDLAVGYIQWQRVPREELDAAGLTDIPDGVLDIDLAIGDARYLGRGVGPRALRLVVERITATATVPMIGMATSTENRVAQKAFAKAGFRRLREFNDPQYGPMYLYIYGNN